MSEQEKRKADEESLKWQIVNLQKIVCRPYEPFAPKRNKLKYANH